MLSTATILTALTGGLAGAFITLGGQALIRYRNRPRPEILFSANVRGCVVNTPAWREDQQGNILNDPEGNPRVFQQRYLRIRIDNIGRAFAQNASVSVTRISFQSAGQDTAHFAEEVFDLKLALTKDKAIFNIPAGGHRFVDLIHSEQEGQHIKLVFDFVVSAARLNLLGFGVGRYAMTVFVAAENCQSVTSHIRWSWDGTLNGLEIVS
jgi:hypothetical protein